MVGRRFLFVLAVVASTLGMAAAARAAAGDDPPRVRISRVGPAYPELARRMRIGGEVTVRVRVWPNGDVAAAKFVAGHPMLAEEAEHCAMKWRFMSGPKASTFTVQVMFDLEE